MHCTVRTDLTHPGGPKSCAKATCRLGSGWGLACTRQGAPWAPGCRHRDGSCRGHSAKEQDTCKE